MKEEYISLPRGAQAQLAKQFGVSRETVSQALKGNSHSETAQRITAAANNLLAVETRNAKAAEARRQIQQLSNDELLAWMDVLRENPRNACVDKNGDFIMPGMILNVSAPALEQFPRPGLYKVLPPSNCEFTPGALNMESIDGAVPPIWALAGATPSVCEILK